MESDDDSDILPSWGSIIFSALIQTALLCGVLYAIVKIVKFVWYL